MLPSLSTLYSHMYFVLFCIYITSYQYMWYKRVCEKLSWQGIEKCQIWQNCLSWKLDLIYTNLMETTTILFYFDFKMNKKVLLCERCTTEDIPPTLCSVRGVSCLGGGRGGGGTDTHLVKTEHNPHPFDAGGNYLSFLSVLSWKHIFVSIWRSIVNVTETGSVQDPLSLTLGFGRISQMSRIQWFVSVS